MISTFRTRLVLMLLVFINYSCATIVGNENETKALLWQIDHPVHPTSYLLGTIHVGVGLKELPPVVEKKFVASDQFISELALSELSPEKSMSLILGKPGQTVSNLLTTAQLNSLENQLRGMVPESLVEQLSIQGAQSLLMLKHFPGGESLDRNLMEKAQALGKKSYGLETLEEQVKSLKLLLTKDALVYLIDNPSELKNSLEELVAVYKAGNLDELSQAILNPPVKEMALSESNLEKVIFERNEAWARVLPSILKKGPTFIAVGAGHLAETRGLLNLLRAQGYTLKRL